MPAEGKPVVLPTLIVVPDPPVPKASLFKPGAVNVVVNDPKILPPHNDIPQPNAPIYSAGPTW